MGIAKLILMAASGFWLLFGWEPYIIHTGNFNQDFYNISHPGMGYNYNFTR